MNNFYQLSAKYLWLINILGIVFSIFTVTYSLGVTYPLLPMYSSKELSNYILQDTKAIIGLSTYLLSLIGIGYAIAINMYLKTLIGWKLYFCGFVAGCLFNFTIFSLSFFFLSNSDNSLMYTLITTSLMFDTLIIYWLLKIKPYFKKELSETKL